MSEESQGPHPVRFLQVGLLRILAIVTVICVVCAILPRMGMIVVAYSPVIFGVLLLRHGVKYDNDIEFACGVCLLPVGFILGSLMLAGVFSHLQ